MGGELGLGILQDVPSLGLSGVFLWSPWDHGFLGEGPRRDVPFSPVTPGVPAANLDLTSWFLHGGGGVLPLHTVLGRVSVQPSQRV